MPAEKPSCRDCCHSFLFLTIAFVTLGGVAAILIASFVFGARFKVFSSESSLLIYLVIVTAVTVLLFLFTLWVSCKKSRASRSLLSVVFAIFDAALYFLSIYAFTQEAHLIDAIGELWSKSAEISEALEQAFNCRGWNESTDSTKPSCQSVIEPQLKKYWKAGAGSLLGLAVLLTIGVVFAFKISCSKDNYQAIQDVDTLHSQPDIGDAPLSEPKPEYKYSW
jgi:glucan phosphoethanolaminetransferase (alkaline phosphatase superfamily)